MDARPAIGLEPATASLLRSVTDGEGDLVVRFFVFFSRFEYALKRAGFVKSGRNDEAEPQWDAFAESIRGKLSKTANRKFQMARAYLLSHPPKKQRYTAAANLHWVDNPMRASESDEQYLLRLVRDVRNNLFHGGKYPVKQHDEGLERNRRLLRHSLTTLQYCRNLNAAADHLMDER
jgi:hypothetical protein